jgi:hypothetical protein
VSKATKVGRDVAARRDSRDSPVTKAIKVGRGCRDGRERVVRQETRVFRGGRGRKVGSVILAVLDHRGRWACRDSTGRRDSREGSELVLRGIREFRGRKVRKGSGRKGRREWRVLGHRVLKGVLDRKDWQGCRGFRVSVGSKASRDFVGIKEIRVFKEFVVFRA